MPIRQALPDERGQYTVWFLLMLPLVLVLIGLVVDGGSMYRWYRRAQIAADTAAQAAAHEVDAAYFAATNQVILEPDAAQVAADYAARNSEGRVQVIHVALLPDNRVRVIARCRVPTIFMRAAGIKQSQVTVVGYARPAFGLNREGQ